MCDQVSLSFNSISIGTSGETLPLVNVARKRFSLFLMSILTFFWGSSFVVVKLGLSEGLTPVATATYRFLIAGALFTALGLLKGKLSTHMLARHMKDLPRFFFLSLTGVTLFFTAQYQGIQMAGASVASILVCLLSPVLISTLSATMLKESLTRNQIFGIGIACVGASIVVSGGITGFESNSDFFLGTLLLLVTPILWAIYSIAGRRMMERYDPFLIAAYVNVLGALCLVPFSAFERSLDMIVRVTFNGWLAITYLAITCSLFGYYIWFYAMRRLGAAVASSFMFAEPLITVLLATTFLGETLSLFTIAGGLLILAGVYAVIRR